MGAVELLILGAAVLGGAWTAWSLRSEFPYNIQGAAEVAVLGIAIVAWRVYVDVVWYFDLGALILALGTYLGYSGYKWFKIGKVLSDDKAIARNHFIISPDVSDAIAAFDAENYPDAIIEFESLANQGDASAQYNLGIMYETGSGALRDDAQAEIWYRKAAEQGLREAQFELAKILAADHMGDTGYNHTELSSTEDTESRFIEAYKWMLLAKRNKYPSASASLRRLRKHMTKDQQRSAEMLVKEIAKQA